MAKSNSYLSVRMYKEPGKSDITEDASANTIIFSGSDNLGNSNIIIKSKRQQFADSRLHIPGRNNISYLFLFTNTAGLMAYISAIICNVNNWKSGVLFILGLVYVLYKLWQLVYPVLVKKLNED